MVSDEEIAAEVEHLRLYRDLDTAADMLLALKARADALEKRAEKLTAGLQVLATTFYKDDQHQAYAKHILDAARAALEAKP